MCCSACSTWSLCSHCFRSPTLWPFPNSIEKSMFFLSRINNIPDIRDSNWGLGNICRNYELSCACFRLFENFVLLLSWKRRIKFVYNKVCNWYIIMDWSSTVFTLRFFFNYVFSLHFFFFFMLFITTPMILILKSFQLHFEFDRHFMNLFLSS